ncbi:MAG: cbb3-type cytochrome oxidase assembly protein [Persicimonas sp.]
MTLIYGLIWGSWVLFGLVTVWALGWAVRSGQFRNVSRGAHMLFDEEEPIGRMTDTFPGIDPEDVPEPDSHKEHRD